MQVQNQTIVRAGSRQFILVAVVLVFFVKCFTLAFFVTPLWDVADETGHYAYAADLAHGRGIPVPGRSEIPLEVTRHWRHAPNAPAEPNWIAQHPPLFYALAAPVIAIVDRVSNDQQVRFRAPRIVSVLFAVAALIALFRALLAATHDVDFSLSAVAVTSFIPTFAHVSSGTNHDSAMAFFGCLAAMYFSRLFHHPSRRDLLLLGISLGLAGAVKLSAVAVTPVLLLLAAFFLVRRGEFAFTPFASATMLAVLPPAVWIFRSRVVAGASLLLAEPSTNVSLNAFEYFSRFPVFDHTVKNFIGLIGWTGTGHGSLRWLQIGRSAYAPFALTILAVVVVTAFTLARADWRDSNGGRLVVLSWLAILIGSFASLTQKFAPFDLVKNLLYALVLSLVVFALDLLRVNRMPIERQVVAVAFVVIAVFTAAYLVRIWNAFQFYGQMRATHGRYFFVILPFLFIAYAWPAVTNANAGTRKVLVVSVPAIFFIADMLFLVRDILPFYGWTR